MIQNELINLQGNNTTQVNLSVKKLSNTFVFIYNIHLQHLLGKFPLCQVKMRLEK